MTTMTGRDVIAAWGGVLAVALPVLTAGWVGEAYGATRTKANNTSALNQTNSWTGATVPVSGDTALWDATITAANSSAIGGAVTVGSVQFANPGGACTISASGASTLTLDANGSATPAGVGIDMALATTNLTVICPITVSTAQTWIVNSGRTLTVSGGITGSGVTLTKDGGGTLTLSTASLANFAGGTLRVDAGMLRSTYNNASALGPAGSTLALNGGKLEITAGTGFNAGLAALSGGGTLFINPASGTPAWSVARMTLAGDLTIAGGTNISGTAAFTLNATALDTNATLTVNNPVSGGGILRVKLGAITPGDAANRIAKAGNGDLDFTANSTNAWAGGVTVRAGRLLFESYGAFGSGGIVLNDAGTAPGDTPTFAVNTGTASTLPNNITVANAGDGNPAVIGSVVSCPITYSGLVTLNQPVVLQGAGSFNITFSGDITGSGAVTVTGNGPYGVSFSSPKSYSGSTTVASGSLVLSGTATLTNTPSITIAGGATLNVASKALVLGDGQQLRIAATGSGNSATNRVASAGNNLTLSEGGLVFTAYNGGANAPLVVTGSSAGALVLNGAPVTVTTTTTLGAGDYTLIAQAGSATGVTGSPGALTVNGAGCVGEASLTVTNNELILHIDPPAAPVITSPLTASAFAGANFTYTITALNRPSGFTAAGLPDGLVLNPASGVITGALTNLGTFAVELGATNVTGTGRATLMVTIAAAAAGVVGDGVNDDTAGIQAMLDTRAPRVYLPMPPVRYMISRTLIIHSGQTLQLERNAVIRLMPLSDTIMITNDDHTNGNVNITLNGGIWDMDNLSQNDTPHHLGESVYARPYDPSYYVGVLLRFNRVTNFCLRSMTFRNPVGWSTQLGNLYNFTVEDITFDHNMQRKNMDGIHVHGNSYRGRISKLKGPTNDDMAALNADDTGYAQMCQGPIEDVTIEDLVCTNGYTGTRFLSAGSPIRRVKVSKVRGTFKYHAASFTRCDIPVGGATTFQDITLNDYVVGRSTNNYANYGLVPFEAEVQVATNITIANFHHTETMVSAKNIYLENGAKVQDLKLQNVDFINRAGGAINLLYSEGSISNLALSRVFMDGGAGGGNLLSTNNNGYYGKITRHRVTVTNATDNYTFPAGKLGQVVNTDADVTGGYAFAFDPSLGPTNIVIPAGTTNIAPFAYDGCTNIMSVVIPGSVVRIGESAFGACLGLTNLVVPEGVTRIDDYAFIRSGLVSITLPASLTHLEASAFYECENLREIIFNGNAPELGASAFYGYTNAVIYGTPNATVYYSPGTAGWSTTFGGVATLAQGSGETHPKITAMTLSGKGLTLEWAASAATQMLERCFDLTTSDWIPVFTVSPSITTNYVEAATNPACFYRLYLP